MIRTQLVSRLEDVLEDTHADHPRRLARWELPLGLDYVLQKRWTKRLRPASVLVAVRNKDAPSIIMTVRSENLRAHGGQISFPGGRRDEGDDFPVGTALREAQEEIDLAPSAVRVIGYLDDYPTISKFRVTPVVALVDADAPVHSDSDEVAEVFELPLSFALERRNYQMRKLGRLGLKYYELNYKHYRIWGATAGMLYNLQQLFEAHELV